MEKNGKGRSVLKLLAFLLATGVVCFFGYREMNNIKLGLDLAGGVSITYEATEENPDPQDMSDTIYKLQKRAEGYSSEAEVYQEGANRINIDIPGVDDADNVLAELGKPGSLEFKAPLLEDGEDGKPVFVGFGETVLDGKYVESAQVYRKEGTAGAADSYEVGLNFNEEGSRLFAEATEKYVGYPIGIFYDNELVSYPVVNEAITGGQCSISGDFDYERADELASTIRLGALKLELTEARSNEVGAKLGEQAIDASIKAGIAGFAIVVVFMIAVYLIPGIAAAIALSMYVGLVLIMLNAFSVTLTLPGVAGIVLSIGMAVDANVIIFTRIKEETGRGSNVANAIKEGFRKALSAIVDGNVTTLIAAGVLYFIGSGTVKGFAQTLAIGIVLSMFTALFVTRGILWSLYGIGFDDKKFYGVKKERKAIDFIRIRKVCYVLSLAIILAGGAGIAMNKSSMGDMFNYGLDFKGGTSTNVTFNEDMTIEEISSEVIPVVTEATGEQSPQTQKVKGTNEVIIKTGALSAEQRAELNDALVEKFGVDESKITSESISGAVSNEMKADAVKAVIIATVLMLIYIWVRFSNIRFATSAVLALCHDVLVTLTFYALLKWAVGSTFIACMLTIVGYSINATIVIFDRIRENLKKDGRTDLRSVVNSSITETLTRSINTSLTTLIMVVCLYVLGVSSIREFALPLIVGIVAGAYSSVFVTGPLWYDFTTRFGKNKQTAEAVGKTQGMTGGKKAKAGSHAELNDIVDRAAGVNKGKKQGKRSI